MSSPASTPRMSRERALELLEHDDLVARIDGRWRTTRRFQGAMARAARTLAATDDPGDDLRVPIVFALVERYGTTLGDDDLASLVAVMLPIEYDELRPAFGRR